MSSYLLPLNIISNFKCIMYTTIVLLLNIIICHLPRKLSFFRGFLVCLFVYLGSYPYTYVLLVYRILGIWVKKCVVFGCYKKTTQLEMSWKIKKNRKHFPWILTNISASTKKNVYVLYICDRYESVRDGMAQSVRHVPKRSV